MLRSKERNKVREIAKARIRQLFEEASKVFRNKPELSHRYVYLARKIAMKANVRIPRNLKRKYCKHCYHYFVPGVNVRIRNHKGKVIYYCLNCKKYIRFVLKR